MPWLMLLETPPRTDQALNARQVIHHHFHITEAQLSTSHNTKEFKIPQGGRYKIKLVSPVLGPDDIN